MASKTTSALLRETVLAPRELVLKTGKGPYENPNREIARRGIRWIEHHVERDSHYMSTLDTRISALIKSGWKIVPAASEQGGKLVVDDRDLVLARFIDHVLGDMVGSFEADVMAMMTHISRGYSLSEINYKYIERGKYSGKVGLESIRYKDQEYFGFIYDKYGHFDPVQNDPEYRVLDKRKFIHFINGFNDENPYGVSNAAVCAFWVWLKENGAKYWSIFQERFGQPIAMLEVPDNLDAEADKQADRIVESVHESTALKVPKGMVLKFLEAMRSGEANYRGFLEFANNEISKVNLGSTLMVETQKNASGSHALGKEHAEMMNIKLSFDIISSMTAINQQLIKRLIDYNFNDIERYPRFQWNAVNSAGFITFAQGIEALQRAGLKIPASWAHEISGIPIAENGQEVLEPSVSVVHPVAGVDNKAGYGSRGREAERFRGAGVCVFNKVARQEAETNDRVVLRGTQELVKRWQKFVDMVASEGVFDFEMLVKYEEKELSGIYHQVFMIGACRGIETARREAANVMYNVECRMYNEGRGTGGATASGGTLSSGWKPLPLSSGVDIASALGLTTYDYYYKPFDKILKEFRAKRILSKREYDALSEEMKRKAFTVARMDSERVIRKIKAELDVVLASRAALPDFYDAVVALFAGCGVLGNGNHLETVLRTNMQVMYNEQRMREFDGLEAAEFPYRRVEIVDDDATRGHHRELAGYTRRHGDPVWSWLRPPFEYNCRCTVRVVHMSEEVEESDWIPDRSRYEFLR